MSKKHPTAKEKKQPAKKAAAKTATKKKPLFPKKSIAQRTVAWKTGKYFDVLRWLILIPLLRRLTDFEDRQIFSLSIAVILPICLVSLSITALNGPLPWKEAFPYLIGSSIGGWASAKWGKRIPVLWLHRGLGILILWGGIRYLC